MLPSQPAMQRRVTGVMAQETSPGGSEVLVARISTSSSGGQEYPQRLGASLCRSYRSPRYYDNSEERKGLGPRLPYD